MVFAFLPIADYGSETQRCIASTWIKANGLEPVFTIAKDAPNVELPPGSVWMFVGWDGDVIRTMRILKPVKVDGVGTIRPTVYAWASEPHYVPGWFGCSIYKGRTKLPMLSQEVLSTLFETQDAIAVAEHEDPTLKKTT